MIGSLKLFTASGSRLLAMATAGVLLAAGLTVVTEPAPAAAAEPLACIDTLYFTNTAAGNVGRLDLATGTVAPTPVFTTPVGAGTGTNQLGIAAGGALAVTGTSTSVVRYSPGASAQGTTTFTAKPAGVANGTMGGINPLTGLYYFGSYTGSTANFYVYDPASGNPPVGPVVSVTVPNPPDTNGDIAFDKTGRLYLVAGGATEAALYVVDGVIPTSGAGANLTARELSRGATTTSTNGIAFGSDGYLYLGGSTVLQKTNPITGASTGTTVTLTGVTSTDLGSCAAPSTGSVAAGFIGPLDQPTDQVRVVLEGGSYGLNGTSPDFPPSASDPNGAGVPSQRGILLPGETYTVRQQPVGTTNLANYTTTWSCKDTSGVVVASGTGSTGTFTAPVGTTGADIDCAFVNVLPSPVAVSDSGAAPFGTPVTLAGATNDQPGNGAILPGQTVFTSPSATQGGTRLDTPEGVWTVGGDGRIVFTPAPGFSGTASTEYRVVDDNGLTSTATATATIRPGPTAAVDTAATTQGTSVRIPVLGNDAPGQNADGTPGAIPPTSLVFPAAGQPAGAVVSDGGRRLAVPGEGVYTVDQATGVVTFAPDPTFDGPTTTPVAYRFSDSLGNPATATITVSVAAVTPAAVNDSTTTPFDTPVTVDVLANDVAGPGGVIVPTATVFTDPAATDGGRTLVTPTGTWRVTPTGQVEFAPAEGFTGTASTPYRITDANGQQSTATVAVTVRPGPVAGPDTASTPQNVDVSFPVLGNDTPGTGPDGSAGTFVPDSFRFIVTPGLPAGSVVGAGGLVLTVPGEGRYTFDPATREVEFDPEPQFTGTATPVTYTVDDSFGNPASTTVMVTVTPISPVATGDAAKTPGGTPVIVDILANDRPGAASAPLVPGSVVFTTPGATDGGKTLVVPGEGTWTVRDDGTVRFSPLPSFSGVTAAVGYTVADANGTLAPATIRVAVGSGAIAAPDAATTPQNTPVTLDILDKDLASDLGNPCDAGETNVPVGCDTGAPVPGSVVFPSAGQPAGAVVSNGGRTITVPGEGVYTLDPGTGAATFTPVPTFTGTATSVVYEQVDSHGAAASSTITVTVTGVTPIARDDSAMTPYATPVTFDFAGNDEPGDPTAPLDIASAVFQASGIPSGLAAEIRDDGKTLDVAGEGVYSLGANGRVTFTPADGFSGTTTPVRYTILDENGSSATAALTVIVRPGPSASPDAERTPQNVPVTVDVLADDAAGQRADGTRGELDPASVVFTAAGQPAGATIGAGGKTLDVPGQGGYAVGADGRVTFTPAAAFRGAATPITYAVTDSLGNTVSSTLTITVDGVDPIARDDSAQTAAGASVTIDVLGDDSPGTNGAVLDAATLRIVGAGGALVTELTVPGEGVWKVVDGKIVFTPAPGFSGRTAAITYSVADANGTRVTATVSVSVAAGAASLPGTGGEVPWLPLGVGLLLLLAGLMSLPRRRASATSPTAA